MGFHDRDTNSDLSQPEKQILDTTSLQDSLCDLCLKRIIKRKLAFPLFPSIIRVSDKGSDTKDVSTTRRSLLDEMAGQ